MSHATQGGDDEDDGTQEGVPVDEEHHLLSATAAKPRRSLLQLLSLSSLMSPRAAGAPPKITSPRRQPVSPSRSQADLFASAATKPSEALVKSQSVPELLGLSEDADLSARMLDASAAPAIGLPPRQPFPEPQAEGPAVREALMAVAEPGDASAVTDQGAEDPALALLLCSARLRARANAAARSPELAPPWRDFLARHIVAALRHLQPFKGVAYTVVDGCAAFGGASLARGDVVSWATISSFTSEDDAATAVALSALRKGVAAVVLQVLVWEGAWALPQPGAGKQRRPAEVLLEPGWAYDVRCTGATRSGFRFATAVQRRLAAPCPVSSAVGKATGSASLEDVMQLCFRLLDAKEYTAAADTLLGVPQATKNSNPLGLASYFLAHGMRTAWPELFTSYNVYEPELLRRVTSAPESDQQATVESLQKLSQRCGESPSFQWLLGSWFCFVDRDPSRGVPLLKSSASAQFPPAFLSLGTCFERGEGVEQSTFDAMKCLEKAANAGVAQAFVSLGLCFKRGAGVQTDNGEAARRFSIAAELGNTAGISHLGACYKEVEGVVADPETAVKLFTLAADRQESSAQYYLAVSYKHGFGGLPKDAATAVRLYRLAAEQGSHAAQSNLAICLFSGDGVEVKDQKEAVRMFRLAADGGNSQAAFNLALCYMNGEGTKQDQEEAARLFMQAAQNGNVGGGYKAGCCFRDGIGVRKDKQRAAQYFRDAADKGHLGAKQALEAL